MNNVAIVVMSCDQYSDLWEPFVKCFEHYWPDCDAPKYLVSETTECSNKFFKKTFTCGQNTVWTDRLDYAMNQIEEDYLIMLCEDYFLCDRIDSDMIQALVEIAKVNDVGNLRLLPNPHPDRPFPKENGIGEISRGRQYRISLQAGIWNKEYLRQFSGMHTSVWDFERMGSAISNEFKQPILCTLRHVFPFVDSVHKGKWEQAGVILCERNEISIDYERRRVMSNLDNLVKYGKGAVIDIAPNLVAKTMNFIAKFKKAKTR